MYTQKIKHFHSINKGINKAKIRESMANCFFTAECTSFKFKPKVKKVKKKILIKTFMLIKQNLKIYIYILMILYFMQM